MRNVLITGSSRGIGAACAVEFAANGDRVFINYKNNKNAAYSTALKVKEFGAQCEVIRCDVSIPDEVREMFGTIEKSYGGVDILVNNAGIAQTKLFTDITDDDWNKMIASDLSSVFYCCRAALPYMIRQHFGRIINISSMWGQIGGSCEVHYSAAKSGVIGLTKALAKEEGLSGITVNCIAPGVIETDMNSNLSHDDYEALKEETPTGTIGSASDVARMTRFLADETSSFITGQVIGVNGGFVI